MKITIEILTYDSYKTDNIYIDGKLKLKEQYNMFFKYIDKILQPNTQYNIVINNIYSNSYIVKRIKSYVKNIKNKLVTFSLSDKVPK